MFATGDAAREAEAAGADVVGADDLVDQDPERLPRLRRRHRDARSHGPGRTARPGARPAWPDAEPQDRHRHHRRRQGGRASSRAARSSTAPTVTATCTCRSARRASTSTRSPTNYQAVHDEILRAKPAASKGRYIKSITTSSTMGPGVKINPDAKPAVHVASRRSYGHRLGQRWPVTVLTWLVRSSRRHRPRSPCEVMGSGPPDEARSSGRRVRGPPWSTRAADPNEEHDGDEGRRRQRSDPPQDRGDRRDPHQARRGRRRGAHRVPRPDGHRARRRCAPRCGPRRPSTRSSRTRWPAGPRRTPASPSIVPLLEGPVAIAFVSRRRGVAAAKALRDFARTQPEPRREGRPARRPRCSAGRACEALADVPPREVLLARLAGGFQAPLVKAAGLFQAFTRNMAYGVKALDRSARRRRRGAAGGRARSRAGAEAAGRARSRGRAEARGRARSRGRGRSRAPRPKPRPSPKQPPRPNRSSRRGRAPDATGGTTTDRSIRDRRPPMATMTTADLLDVFKNMTVLELNDFLKAFEEEFGVTAAAPVAVGRACGRRWWRRGRRGRGEGRVRRHPHRRRRQEDPGHQGGARRSRASASRRPRTWSTAPRSRCWRRRPRKTPRRRRPSSKGPAPPSSSSSTGAAPGGRPGSGPRAKACNRRDLVVSSPPRGRDCVPATECTRARAGMACAMLRPSRVCLLVPYLSDRVSGAPRCPSDARVSCFPPRPTGSPR